MPLSRGARRCFALIQDLARGSLGCACPSREWLAVRLDCPLRTLDRWTAELRAKGYIAVTKRQHHAALYTVLQTCQNDKSGGKSNGKSERRYIGRVKLSTSEELWPKPMGTATQNSPEMEGVLKWAEEHGYEVKTGADLFRAIDAMDAA